MTADIDTQNETLSSGDVKDALIEQYNQKSEEKKDAFQKQKTNEVPVPEHAEDGEQMGQGGEEEQETDDPVKTFQYKIGDDSFDIDETATFEVKADGKVRQMTLKEMRDAAAGGVAVRNRLRQLAEEKKNLYKPYREFSKISEQDPMLALKKMFSVIKGVDSNVDLNKFLTNLGKQAQNLARMSPSERKSYELERELDETKSSLSESERIAAIQEMRQELMTETGLSEEQVYEFGQSILQNPTLAKTIKSENELFDRIGDLADEVQRQQAAVSALHKYDSKLKKDDPLVFELSSLLQKNPDFDQDDLDEIAEEVLRGVKKNRASTSLSKRQRSNVVKGYKKQSSPTDFSKMSPKEALMAQILQKRNGQTTTR